MNESLEIQLKDETRFYLSDKTISLQWIIVLILLTVILSCFRFFGFISAKLYVFFYFFRIFFL